MAQADLDAADDRDADFRGERRARRCCRLRWPLARTHDLRLCFVRVLRRPRERPAAARVGGAAAVRRGPARVSRRPTGACFLDDRDDPGSCATAVRRRRPHRARGDGSATPTVLAERLAQLVAMIFHSLDFVVFFLVTTPVYWRLPHRGAERAAARRQLLLLRLRASVVSDADLRDDGRRLLGGARHGGAAGAQAAAASGSASS